MKKSKLTIYIFSALILGVFVGWAAPGFAVKMQPLADIFLRMIKMIIAPLLFATLVVGIAGHGDVKSLGKVGLKTLVYFEVVTTIALLIGLGASNYFEPGKGFSMHIPSQNLAALSQMQTVHLNHSISSTFVNMIPTSVVDAMAKGDMLQIVIFAVFFSLALCAVGDKGKPVLNLLNSISDIMFKFTEYVMYFAPLGVFGAIAHTIGQNGIGVLGVYAKLIGVMYFSLAVFVITVLLIACKIVKIPFRGLIKTIQEPALLAFSTASSEAALPKAMDVMEKFGVPKNIVGFVMPAGYTFNLDGSALYLSMAALFVAQMSGIHLSIAQQLMIMFTLMLTSKGVAGVPRVSLVVLTGTLVSFNLPLTGVAVLLGIDQILDMGRTTVNLIGNCVATTVIARWENSFNYKKMNYFLGRVKEPVSHTCDIVLKPKNEKKDIDLESNVV